VKRVLITGMSGTGKSSLVAELAALGYKAVDTDAAWCEPQPDGRQRWREDAIQALLAAGDTDVLFVA
jgi:dephospho-CoA kinase